MSVRSTSPEWLRELTGGDPAAWERFVRDYRATINHALHGAPRGVDREDLLQDVLREVSAGLPRFERRREGSLRAWLRVIARRAVVDAWRARGREPSARGESALAQLPARAPSAGTGSPVPSSLAARDGAVLAALERVRVRVRERTWLAFVRTVLEGRAPSDVAAELGTSPVAVRIAKSRVLARLRAELG